MGSTVKGGNSSNGSNNHQKARPYALLLLAFAMAFLVVMVLHKFRERQVLALVAAENDQQLVALHSLLQTEQLRHQKAKKKILQIKERHKVEAKQMQSTISSLNGERDKLHAALKAKNHEIKKLREQQLSYSNQLSQVAALREILKQKEFEIEELKSQQLTPVKVWSVSSDDPSSQPTDLTATELYGDNEDVVQLRESDHSENSSNGTEDETSHSEESSLSTNGGIQSLEGVHLVEKMDATEDSSKSEDINEDHSIGGNDLKEINIDETQGKDNDETQGKGESTIAQETSTEAEETSSRQTPTLDEEQEGKSFDDVQRGGLATDKIKRSRKVSHHRRHRSHRGKRWREYVRSRRMGKADRTETKATEDAETKITKAITMESQNTTGANAQPNSNVTQDHINVKETANKSEIAAQEALETVSSEQSIATNSSSQNGERLTEDRFANIPLSIKLEETQRPEEVTAQTTPVATEQENHAETEEQGVMITGKEQSEVSTTNDDSKRNFTDDSKQQETQKPEEYSAKEEHSDANNKENSIEQVSGKEKAEDTEDADAGIQVTEALAQTSFTQSKPKEDVLKTDFEEEEEFEA
ncbi:hypothetical protein Droror1_Dr00003907 [Drosera rotundifolia]